MPIKATGGVECFLLLSAIFGWLLFLSELVLQTKNTHMAMWYAWAVGLYFIPTGIGWIIFSNFSMKRIEKQIKANDIDPGYNWDGVGARIFYYAFAIIATEKFAPRLNQLIDTEQVRKIATHQDWLRAICFVLSLTPGLALRYSG